MKSLSWRVTLLDTTLNWLKLQTRTETSSGLTSLVIVTACAIIKVQDYNDHDPQFLANLYNDTVTETASIGTTVTEVFAVDRDKGANGHIMYSIISGSSKRCTCWR
ncbi:hypothetical protein Pcinc_001368 [Petrolisthes cinctipes]|uniref:Cadherin domain-containing protein n=1 Tax=Petrolisthes cinctipes TaxID=88211 RepID=A0AAE1GN26_PETCI|nr:hypothetical protein Pcinc_001368 [Petrolisthes cinctipes]